MSTDNPGHWNRYAGSRMEQLDQHREQFEPEAEEIAELEHLAEEIEERERKDRQLNHMESDPARHIQSSDPARIFVPF